MGRGVVGCEGAWGVRRVVSEGVRGWTGCEGWE